MTYDRNKDGPRLLSLADSSEEGWGFRSISYKKKKKKQKKKKKNKTYEQTGTEPLQLPSFRSHPFCDVRKR
jgi:hypothetical protein